MPSVLWRCWLGGRKGIRPVKNWVVRCWRGYLSGARCRLACAQLMPLPLTVSCFSKIQIGFTFLVPAHPGSPGHKAVKWVCVCCQCRLLLYRWGMSLKYQIIRQLRWQWQTACRHDETPLFHNRYDTSMLLLILVFSRCPSLNVMYSFLFIIFLSVIHYSS